VFRKVLRNRPEQCPGPGVHNNAAARSAGHRGSEETGIRQIQWGLRRGRRGLGRLFDGHGLPGKGRLTDEEILGGKQPHVRRDDRTGLQQDDIPRHDLGHPDLGFLTVADHHGSRLDTLAECFNRPVRPPIEDIGKADTKKNHGGDDDRRFELADHAGDDADQEQLDDKRAFTPAEDVFPETQTQGLRYLVGAEFDKAARHLLGVQPVGL